MSPVPEKPSFTWKWEARVRTIMTLNVSVRSMLLCFVIKKFISTNLMYYSTHRKITGMRWIVRQPLNLQWPSLARICLRTFFRTYHGHCVAWGKHCSISTKLTKETKEASDCIGFGRLRYLRNPLQNLQNLAPVSTSYLLQSLFSTNFWVSLVEKRKNLWTRRHLQVLTRGGAGCSLLEAIGSRGRFFLSLRITSGCSVPQRENKMPPPGNHMSVMRFFNLLNSSLEQEKQSKYPLMSSKQTIKFPKCLT